MPKRVSTRRVKGNLLYTYEEAGETVGVTAQTIRAWRDAGLPVLDGQRPHGVMGFALKDFIDKRTNKSKRSLRDDEVYCLTCKAPRSAYGGMADYVPITDDRGRLEALCSVCEGRCNRLVRSVDLPRFSAKLAIVTKCGANA